MRPPRAPLTSSSRPSRSMNMRSKRSKIFSSWVTAMTAALLIDGQLAQEVHDDLRALRIERGRRLVGQDDARTIGERAGDGDALRLAARKLRRERVLAAPDLEIVEQFDRPLARRGMARSPASCSTIATLSMALRNGSRL